MACDYHHHKSKGHFFFFVLSRLYSCAGENTLVASDVRNEGK